MRNIVIVDSRESFTKDISTRLLLGEEYDFEISSFLSNLDGIDKIIENKTIDEICINSSFLAARSNWNIIGPRITSYANDMTGVKESMDYNIPSYGIAKQAGVLLDLINENKAVLKEGTNKEVQPNHNIKNEAANEIKDLLDSDNVSDKPKEDIKENEKSNYSNNISLEDLLGIAPSNSHAQKNDVQSVKSDIIDTTNNNKMNIIENDNPVKHNEYNENSPKPTKKKTIDIRENMFKEEEQEKISDYMQADGAIRRKKKKKTEVITVYSAKGGVGKTTIACNLATYIAMLSNGRRKYRVCVIDYNFDFGDALNTLGFSTKGPTMSEWVDNIQTRLGNGEDIKNITYNKEEIYDFLQKKDDIDLYALLAPVTHKASLIIHNEELEIMINNLIKYGDFDYIVCDTGNNTRNSSILSLENADRILVVVTQDVTTVYDNATFLEAIDSIRCIDEDRISLVINRARSKSETKISCKEIEENFDMPCIAKFKENSDVIKANNIGIPLVYEKNHEFTKEIGNIATMITGISEYKPIKFSVTDRIKNFFGF